MFVLTFWVIVLKRVFLRKQTGYAGTYTLAANQDADLMGLTI